MKKLTGIIVIALAVSLLCAPMLLGRHAQQRVEAIVQTLNDYPGYEVSIRHYQRSWLSTTAEIELGIDTVRFDGADQASLAGLSLTLLLAVDHGPVLARDGIDFGLYAWRAGFGQDTQARLQQTFALQDDEPFYRLRGKTSLLGTTEFQDKVRDFRLQSPELVADFSGYNGRGAISRTGQMTYEGALGEASFTQDNSSGSLEGLAVHYAADFSRLNRSSLVFPADMVLTLDKAQLRTPFDGGGSVEGLRLASNLTLNDDGSAFDAASEFSLTEALTDLGNASDIKVVLSVLNVDEKAYQAYLDAVAEVSANSNDPSAPVFSRIFDQALMQQFIARGPEIRLDELALTVPQGSMKANFVLSVDKDAQAPDPQMLIFWLMSEVAFNAHAEMDRPLAELFARLAAAAQGMVSQDGSDPGVALLDMLIAQGILTVSDGKVTTGVALSDGKISVNGQPFPLGATY